MADLEILTARANALGAAAKQEKKASEFPKDKKLKKAVRKQRMPLLKADKELERALELDEVPDERYKMDKNKT